jgi:hypothetical protein
MSAPTLYVLAAWRLVGKTLEWVTVRTGITDGSVTEILGGSLNADDRVVTAVATGTTATTRTTASSSGATKNPLMETGMPGPPPGR